MSNNQQPNEKEKTMDIDHELTPEIVCPFCGHEYQDSWEKSKNEDGADVSDECVNCGKTFEGECVVVVYYTTRKPKVQPQVDCSGGQTE